MKRVYIICSLSALFLLLMSVVCHSVIKSDEKSIKVGFVYVGDEITPYTKNFVNSQLKAEEDLGDNVEFEVRYNVPEDRCEESIRELVNEGCDYIIAPSYGYGTHMKEIAKEYPDIQFCVPTGDNANVEPIVENYHNTMGTIYQGRYICGVVAGMKLREMIDQGIIEAQEARIGYVAAFPYSEVISGYTAFYLGVASIVPEATMYVKYTNTWSSYATEKQIANELIENGCVVISQHSDTTGPAVACENATGDIPVYHVGYNQSMTEIAPTRSLVSCSIDYTPFFEQSIAAVLNGKKIESQLNAKTVGNDSMAGFEKEWIKILDINKTIVADGTEAEVDRIIEQFKEGNLTVFKGTYTGTDPFDSTDTIDLSEGYEENEKTSSPGFHYVLDDVITILP